MGTWSKAVNIVAKSLGGKERFEANNDEGNDTWAGILAGLMMVGMFGGPIIGSIFFVWGIVLAAKCKKDKAIQLLFSLMFPGFYLLYRVFDKQACKL